MHLMDRMPGFKFICKSHRGAKTHAGVPRLRPGWRCPPRPALTSTTHTAATWPHARAPPVLPLEHRGPEEVMRPLLGGSLQESAGSALWIPPERPLQRQEASAPLTQLPSSLPSTSAEGLASWADEKHTPCSCGLRVPPPGHRMENDTGVARLKIKNQRVQI